MSPTHHSAHARRDSMESECETMFACGMSKVVRHGEDSASYHSFGELVEKSWPCGEWIAPQSRISGGVPRTRYRTNGHRSGSSRSAFIKSGNTAARTDPPPPKPHVRTFPEPRAERRPRWLHLTLGLARTLRRSFARALAVTHPTHTIP